MKNKHYFLAIIWFVCNHCCKAQSAGVVYTDIHQLIEIGGHARYFIDSTNKLSHLDIENIPDSRYAKVPDKIINMGFSPYRIWFKFDLKNRTDENLYAIMLAQDIDYVDVYAVSEDTTFFLETGALRPFENRYFELNSIVVNLGRKPQKLYIGLKDMNGLISQIEVGTIRPLMKRMYRETSINFFVLGVLALSALFSFFMFLFLKERTYFLFTLHVVFSALTLLSLEGYLFDFLWRDMPFMNNGVNSSLIRLCTLLTSIGFSVEFLNLREVLPKLHRVFQGLGVLATTAVLTKLIGIQQAEVGFNIMILLIFGSYLATGMWLYRRGFGPARFYLLGWGIYIFEILLIVCTLFNVLTFEHFYTYYGYHIGVIFQTALLTFALMDRINTLRRENLEARELAMQRLTENERLMAEQAVLLEKELEQQPIANNDLQKLLKLMRDEREKIKKIPIATLEGVLLFPVADIVRIEAMGSYANVHFFNHQKMVASRSLAEFEQQLGEYDNFFKVHKSHIINLNFVTKYVRGDGGIVFMQDGSEVDVARRVKPDFLRAMGLEN
ncbi:7TM diverse intracellular signaling domain-containing protein [Runella aurantiaca]|uniref:7TM diverse intracellular signaling domain-containing protein n=1 Tax=Runella aurantiaca TaxID=2282308 RepID=UPI001E3E7869|nr:7TM diverse intracellular signaling domain-containing protein [Runella aurantiaca]